MRASKDSRPSSALASPPAVGAHMLLTRVGKTGPCVTAVDAARDTVAVAAAVADAAITLPAAGAGEGCRSDDGRRVPPIAADALPESA